MYTLLKPFKIREELLKKRVKIFTPLEFGRIFAIQNYKTKRYLKKWVQEGFIVRLRQGLYALKSDLPSEEEIANRLYQPSYLSFEYALAFYNILPEMTYTITSATTKPTRNFTADSKVFSYLKIKQQAYTGYKMVQIGERMFLIAEPEKAFVDYLYFAALGKKPLNERLNPGNLDRGKIQSYARLYNRPKLSKLIKESYDQH